MAKYIYAEEVPESSVNYLTAGKRYVVISEHDRGDGKTVYGIKNDNERTNVMLSSNCAHLEGGSWIETDTP